MNNIEPILAAYQRNVAVIKTLTTGMDHAKSILQPPLNANCANWLVGHLLVYRNRLMKMCGAPPAFDENVVARYVRDSKPVLTDEPGLGKFEDMIAAFEASQSPLADGYRTMSPEAAAKEWAWPGNSMSAADWLVSLLRHEAYHTGQLEWLAELSKSS